MTDQELNEIEVRMEAATPQPWVVCQWGDGSQEGTGRWNVGIPVFETILVENISHEDAVFIAKSREDIPNLIRALKDAKKLLQLHGKVIG